MEYLIAAYALIALVLIGYTISVQRRRAHIERERAYTKAAKD